jgi:hypothetical protein
MIGYIYIRNHLSYENCVKLGVCINIYETDDIYSSRELIKGYYVKIYEVEVKNEKTMKYIENYLNISLKTHNIKYDGGDRFFDKIIINEIEDKIKSIYIKYKKLSDDEVNNINKKNNLKAIFNKINKKRLIEYLKQQNKQKFTKKYN